MSQKKNKRVFPDDWSDLTEKQVLDNVRYLKRNFKQYKLKLIDDNTVSIDNIKITSLDKKMDDGIYHRIHIINNKSLCRLYISDFSDVCALYSICKHEIEQIKKRHKRVIGTVMLIIILLFAEVCMSCLENKKQETKNKEIFNQEIIKQNKQDTVYMFQNQR